MKALLFTLTLVATSAFAGDKEVGQCGAYHLLKGNKRIVQQVMLKARDKAEMQAAARELLDLANRDLSMAMRWGQGACLSIGVPMN
jgi:hypothetical protein